MFPKAMTKRDETRRFQRVGGRCEPMARGFRSYGFRAGDSMAAAPVGSPVTAALRQKGCWTLKGALFREDGAI